MQTFAEWVGGLSWGGVPLKNMSVSRENEVPTFRTSCGRAEAASFFAPAQADTRTIGLFIVCSTSVSVACSVFNSSISFSVC